jgi:hypothetical protein
MMNSCRLHLADAGARQAARSTHDRRQQHQSFARCQITKIGPLAQAAHERQESPAASPNRRPSDSGRKNWLARPKRFELLTPRFVVWCSIQLSYGRVSDFSRLAHSAGEAAAFRPSDPEAPTTAGGTIFPVWPPPYRGRENLGQALVSGLAAAVSTSGGLGKPGAQNQSRQPVAIRGPVRILGRPSIP